MKAIYPVDDDGAVRASLFALLSVQPGLVVRSFASGDDFLAVADELDPGVVLLDVNMPGTCGLEVLRAIRGSHRGKFAGVMLTGQGNIDTAVEAMKAGAIDFVEKPYAAEALLGAIDTAFDVVSDNTIAASRAAGARARIEALSGREREVLDGLVDGKPNKVIAAELGISPRTVEIYRANLMAKLEATSLADIVRLVLTADEIA